MNAVHTLTQSTQCNSSKDEIKADQNIRKIITDQTAQWSELIERHKKEEWELLKVQLNDQQEIIKKLMEQTQSSQMKQLEAKQERETKALNSQQAKISVETAKEVNVQFRSHFVPFVC